MLHITKKSNATAGSAHLLQKSLLCGVSLIAASVMVGPRTAQAQTVTVVNTATTEPTVYPNGSVIVTSTGKVIGLGPIYNAPGNEAVLISIAGGGLVSGVSGSILSDALLNYGSITNVTNAGTVSGLAVGIANLDYNGSVATIANLSNSGTISGIYSAGTVTGTIAYGIENTGVIGSLSNMAGGTIYGAETGIYNTGSITQLSNATQGHIKGSIAGLSNSGNIVSIADSGSITGSITGLINSGHIGTLALSNNGVITGGTIGADNSGTIANVTIGSGSSIDVSHNYGGRYNNYGNDGKTAFVNTGAIGTLTNAGAITGGQTGLYNSGSISLLSVTNTGVISGSNVGAINEGTIANVSIASGGAIDISSSNYGRYNGDNGNVGFENYSTIGNLTDAGLIAGGVTGLYNSGTISLLAVTNTGVISGSDAGVTNYGTITTVTIAAGGLIEADSHQNGRHNNSSSRTGFYNDGVIGVLTNNGGIVGAATGLYNDTYGTISQLINGGSIVGNRTSGVGNAGVIATLTNSGLISGHRDGVYNAGTITSLNNAGTITGRNVGVYNQGIYSYNENYDTSSAGTIGIIRTLTNSGTIHGNITGVYNAGTIGLLSNNGTITGGAAGILNAGSAELSNNYNNYNNNVGSYKDGSTYFYSTEGSIGTLTNSGLIDATGNGYINSIDIAGVNNQGYIGTLTNSATGTIIGAQTGIVNFGQIKILTNAGTIVGTGSSGIQNKGLINTLTNTGKITGGSSGIDNYGGSILTLTNSGSITGTSNAGIFNAAFNGTPAYIGTLTNNAGGVIKGGSVGIENFGTSFYEYSNGCDCGTTHLSTQSAIGAITNSGTITGGRTGILNAGLIGTITNHGIITGGYVGLVNGGNRISESFNGTTYTTTFNAVGTINLLTNTGTISGGNTGLANYGFIGSLANSGLILGQSSDGIYNDRNIGTLTNLSGGTIDGGLVGIDNFDYIGTLTNGGLIEGTDDGIVTYDSINVLTNNQGGIISGGFTGLYNEDFIGTLTNSGLIKGYDYIGIYNDSEIDALTNLAGGTIYGGDIGIRNDGNIGTLTNSGLIHGYYDTGIENEDQIYTLTNTKTGTIAGGSTGIYNNGYIGTLTNAGLIEGGAYGTIGQNFLSTPTPYGTLTGIRNDAAILTLNNLAGGTIAGGDTGIYNGRFIGTLTNAGLIEGGVSLGTIGNQIPAFEYENGYYGIYNDGAILALDNLAGGTITGTWDGIYTNRYIGSLSNAGVISGEEGVFNDGYIGALTNSGTIAGTYTGLDNDGQIGRIFNSGLISGGDTGIYSDGSRTTLTNTGVIKGDTGIYLDGYQNTIVNSGTIASTDGGDAITLYGANSLILTTGSDLIGTIYGGGSSSTITLEGTDAMSNTFADFGYGSSLTVAPGANWEADGSWTIASVTNNGNFEGGKIGTPLDLTGNFTQNADGELVVVVTPKASSQFVVDGNVHLAGGVIYELAPGIYGAVKDYQYLTIPTGDGTITGSFATQTITSAATGSYATQIVADPSANLLISGSFTVDPVDQSIFGDQTQALAGATQDVTSDILGKATEGGSNADPACAAESPASLANLSASNDVANTSRIASTLANVFCGEGGWVEATGSINHTDASGGAAAYDADTEGFLAGVDKPLGTFGTRLGFAVGFDHTSLTDKAGGSGSMGTTRIALYGSQPLGNFTLAATVGYGFASNSTTRDSDFGDFSENNSLGIFSAGVQGSTHISLGAIDMAPAAGIKIASVQSTNFSEPDTGTNGAFAVSGTTPQYTSVQPYVSARFSESFLTASNVVISPDALIGYEYETDAHGVATNVQFATGGGYQTLHSNLDQGDALISAGLSAVKNNWTLFVTYTGRISGNWSTQTGEAGLRIKF